MKITISRVALVSAVERLVPITPAKPMDPAHGQLRFVVDGERVTVDATDGEIKARVQVPIEDGEGMDVLPAAKMAEIARLLGGGEELVEIDTADRSRAILRSGSMKFTIPLHSSQEFPTFPALPDDETAVAVFNTDEFVAALGRVAYAMGGPQAKPETRMVRIADGTVSAYSGRRVQEAVLESHGAEVEVLIRDEALSPLVRFLRASGQVGVTLLAPVEFAVSEERSVTYYVVSSNDAAFAFPRPSSSFTDLTRTWQIADEQRAAAGVLSLDRAGLLNALRAARVQTDPKEPRVALDIDGSADAVRLWAQIDQSTEFETYLPASYTGKEDARTVAASLDDLQAMVEAYPEPTVGLLVAPKKFSSGRQRPLVQLVDNRVEARPARALIPQTEAP